MRGSKARQERQRTGLFQPVGHLNPCIVAGENGEGNHIFEESNKEIDDPRRRADMPQQSQQVAVREISMCRILAMRRLSVLLTAIGRRLGGVFELSFGKKNMLTKLKERLARRRQLAREA